MVRIQPFSVLKFSKKKFFEYFNFFFTFLKYFLKKKKQNFFKYNNFNNKRAVVAHVTISKKKIAPMDKIYYITIPRQIFKIFWYAIPFQIHNWPCYHFTMRFFNIYYFFMIEFNAEEFIECDYFSNILDNRLKFSNFSKFFINYFNFYNIILNRIIYDNNNFFKTFKNKYTRCTYNLIFTCRNNKFFVNLHDNLKINYLFLSCGLFIKYFDKKKLFKKNKTLRVVMIKYLRKLFLLMKLSQTILILRKNPIFFLEFLNLFYQQIPYKFNEPVTNKETKDDGRLTTKFLYFIFLNSENFTTNKTKKKGRVKRKIYRKIILRNSVID